MNTEKVVEKASVVAYGPGYYKVTKKTKDTVNLGSIFGGTIFFKGVPITEVREAHDEWYAKWSQSETYMSM